MMNINKNNESLVVANFHKRSNLANIWMRLRKNKLAMIGLGIIVFLILVVALADIIAPYDYAKQDYSHILELPSVAHWFGTDNFGRDILTRLIYGGRISLLVSLMATALSLIIGGIFGAIAGYAGGKVDNVIMRLADLMMAIPGTLLSICVSATLGGGVWQTAIAISIGGIAPTSRLIRATALTIRNQEYIEASRAAGASQAKLIFSHVIPNCLAPIIVDMSLRLGGNIMMISAMSFIGLGVQPPTPEWGQILNAGRDYIREFWPLTTFPGLAIMFTMFGFNVLGDGLRDALDPKLK